MIDTLTIIWSLILMKTNGIDGVAFAYLIANTIGAIIVIKRIKRPIEYTIKKIKYYRCVLSV